MSTNYIDIDDYEVIDFGYRFYDTHVTRHYFDVSDIIMKIFNLLFQEKLAQIYSYFRYICLVSNDVAIYRCIPPPQGLHIRYSCHILK